MKYVVRFIFTLGLIVWLYILIPIMFAIIWFVLLAWNLKIPSNKLGLDMNWHQVVVNTFYEWDGQQTVCIEKKDYYNNIIDYLLYRNKKTDNA